MKPRHPIAGLDSRRTQSADHRLDLLSLAIGLTAAALALIFALVIRT
jgi:hypothetical protein